MALKREVTPTGPISVLFDRLHSLHLHAGEPGVREISRRMGRDGFSPTTVHNVFRGPRVPKWEPLRRVVEQLNGDEKLFLAMWSAARAAERSPGQPPESAEVIREVSSRLFDLVMVTYRMPFGREPDDSFRARWQSGVVDTATRLGASNSVWIGWSSQPDAQAHATSSTLSNGQSIHVLDMSAHEVELHYDGYCNSTLWPVYHCNIERPEFRPEWRHINRVINERFAAPGATVWIHDYQLQLVPELVRRQRPDLRIGFFLHIPMPPPEIFRQLPDRTDIVRGILGADLVGFQSPLAAHNFLHLARDLLHLQISGSVIVVEDRRVTVDAFPISVDTAIYEEIAALPRIRRRAAQIRNELGEPHTLLLGIDRLDYTKGIELRLQAYGQLLASQELSADGTVFVQVGTISRERLAMYVDLRARVDSLAGRLNGSYARVGRPVVHYTNQHYKIEELVALYNAADVLVTTPLSDGMNLTAKEYVASRVDNRGALVLSEFAGAAAELDEALLVNPNDVDDLRHAILLATTMSYDEQERRMAAMRATVRRRDIHAWASTFLETLRRSSRGR